MKRVKTSLIKLLPTPRHAFLMGILLVFLVTLPYISPAFAEASIVVTSEVNDFDHNGYPDIKFSATALGTPQQGVSVDVTPDGSIGPLYAGSTDSSGAFILKDVPFDKYDWVSSSGDTGTVTINPSDYPLEISEEVAFWLWFLAFKCEAPSGQKGEFFLKELAKYVGYDIGTHPLPPKASNDYENAKNYMVWTENLEDYVDQNLASKPRTYEATKTSIQIVKQAIDITTKFRPAVDVQITIQEYVIVTSEGDVPGTITYVGAQRVFDIRGASYSAIGIFLGVFDLAVIKPNVIAEMRPDELEEHWFEIELQIFQDFLGISAGMFGIAKAAFLKLGVVELSKTAAAFASALGAAIGIVTVWLAILDYNSKYPDSPFWEHFNDWQVWQDMLLVVGGSLIAIGSVIAFLSYAGVLAVGAGAAITGVGLAITVVALVIALGMWIYNWWNYGNQIQELRSQLSEALTNIYRTRESLNSVDTGQLQQASDESLKFATYALHYAAEITGEMQSSLQIAHDYLVTLSQAQLNLRSAVIDANIALDNLIGLYLDYSLPSDPSKKIVAHLEGVNSIKAEYVTSTNSFQVNASIYSDNNYAAKRIEKQNLDGSNYCPLYLARWETDLLHPLGHWVGWAFEPPVEHDNQGHEFAVTYKTTSSGNDFLVDNDPDAYDHSANWKALTDSGTFYLYKFFFDQKDDDALNPWLNAIQGTVLSNAQQKLSEVQKAANSLRMATLSPKQREYAGAILVDSYSFVGASIQGDSRAFHVFDSPLGFLTATEGNTFLIMSTGIAAYIPGSPEDFESTDFDSIGPDGDTASLTLKLLVPSSATTLSFDFRFMSEEYPEYVGSVFNDFFYAYLTDSTGTHQVAFDDNGQIINVNNNFFNPNIYPIGTVFDGATKRLTTTVNVDSGETITLQFVVGDAGDGIYDTAVFLDNVRFNLGGGSGTTPTADVMVVKNGPNSVEQGKQFTYTINYFNIEEAAAQNAVVTDNLPSQVTFVSASAGGTYSSIAHSVTWHLGTLQPFSSGSLTLIVLLPSAVPLGTLLQNLASISTTSQESNSNNNQYTKTATVAAGTSLPPNVEVGPTVSNYNGIPVLYWTTPITFTYHGDATVIGADINIHLPDGGPDISGPMTNILGTYDWTFTYTFYPRHGQGTVTYTVHYADGQQSTAVHGILVDPSGYVYNAVTGERIPGVTVTLYRFDIVLQQFVLIAPDDPGIEPHTNPQITDENGGYGWMVSVGMYMIKAEKAGYATNLVIVTVPPPATDLNIPLTPIDADPPTTNMLIGEPHYTDVSGNTYVTSATSFTLIADDGPDGSGVAATYYRKYNVTYDSDWKEQPNPFYMTGLDDGDYSIDYYSTDVAGNIEDTNTQNVTLDNTAPSLTIETPTENDALQDGVNFTVSAWDLSFVASVTFSIQCAQGNVISPIFVNMPGTHTADCKWILCFDTRQLSDGFYLLSVNGTDVLGNSGITTVPFSIRNWASVQLLPSTPNNKAGRTMPIKFSLKVNASVDPAEPFIWNEELVIKIYVKGNPETILQTSTYGTTSMDYRIDSAGELYITNFKTMKTAATYVVEIYRKDLLIDSFEFSTVQCPGDVNGDGKVNVLDAAAVSAHWYPGPPQGTLGYATEADLNQDGIINMLDAAIVSANWGNATN